MLFREEGEYFVDSTPFPVPRSSHKSPELPGTCCCRVTRPGGVHWGKRRKREGRKKPWEVEPGSGPIGGTGSEVRPGVETETVEGAKKGEIVQSGKAQGDRAAERVGGGAHRGG